MNYSNLTLMTKMARSWNKEYENHVLNERNEKVWCF